MARFIAVFLAVVSVLCAHRAEAQDATGALIGSVQDAQGGVLRGAPVRVSSPALIGGPRNAQHFSGKPWAATAQIALPQGDQRIMLEPRGSRRLSSQTLVDVRLSKSIVIGGSKRVELLADVLNLLNDTAEE